MIFNPKKLYDQKAITNGDEKYLTPNGYDLRLATVTQVSSNSTLRLNDDYKGMIETKRIESENGIYFLASGKVYELETIEKVNIPQNTVGIIFSRSTFNRNGIIIRGTLFDSGFKGRPSLTIYPFINLEIEVGTPIAQIVFMEAEANGLYEGKYQEKE
jgi:deoxycytidine triphosphate deaminase